MCPNLTEAFAHRRDACVWKCLQQILKITPDHDVARVTASLPFSVGGLGLPAESRSREGAHWASWADWPPRSGSDHGARDDQGPCGSQNVRDTLGGRV